MDESTIRFNGGGVWEQFAQDRNALNPRGRPLPPAATPQTSLYLDNYFAGFAALDLADQVVVGAVHRQHAYLPVPHHPNIDDVEIGSFASAA